MILESNDAQNYWRAIKVIYIYRVEKMCFFTIHCNHSLVYIAVRDLQSPQRNASMQSLLLASNFFSKLSRMLVMRVCESNCLLNNRVYNSLLYYWVLRKCVFFLPPIVSSRGRQKAKNSTHTVYTVPTYSVMECYGMLSLKYF